MPPPALEPIVERTLLALEAKLALISQANGFYTDAGTKLNPGVARLPIAQWNGALALWVESDGEELVAEGEGRATAWRSTAFVTVWVYVHADNARRELARIVADVKRVYAENLVPIAEVVDSTFVGVEAGLKATSQGDLGQAAVTWEFRYDWSASAL